MSSEIPTASNTSSAPTSSTDSDSEIELELEPWPRAPGCEPGELAEVAAMRGALSAALVRFVEGARARGHSQRGAAWYAALGETVGGSNIGTILGGRGAGFISTARDLALARLGAAQPRSPGRPATWWGQLFEDVLAGVVAADLGGDVLGDDICIQAFAGHRTSPDGLVVARVTRDARIWTTDAPAADAVAARVLLLEFKCPVSRRPVAGVVPVTYAAQVQSGLMVAPLAAGGLFVDAVFRRAALLDLGPGPAFALDDQAARDAADSAEWLGRGAFAWGAVALVADTPDGIAAAFAAAAADPWGDPADATLPIDAGAAARAVFDRLLGAVASGRLRAAPGPPAFADGRRGSGVAAPPAWCRADSPLPATVAVVGWKLFQLEYVPVAREAGFGRRALAALADVHAAARRGAAAACAAGWTRGNPVSAAARAALDAAIGAPPPSDEDADMLAEVAQRGPPARRRAGVRPACDELPPGADDSDFFAEIAARRTGPRR